MKIELQERKRPSIHITTMQPGEFGLAVDGENPGHLFVKPNEGPAICLNCLGDRSRTNKYTTEVVLVPKGTQIVITA